MKAVERPTGKLGHKCPSCLAELERPLKPNEPGHAMARPIDLHWSKKAPGELECPNCKGTFPVAAQVAEEPEKPAAKKKSK